ncbi:sensor histidine kinase [Spiractinospora alimapuensis]|uniref:sensor histidine kinase n=1 Tax=Spiractinospora alimapuensis TaxID=2820884 RepID=UPI001F2BFBFB|nr:sensor histidine kinase [Spiractinospora alimapuensis]QVQ50691.1 sensor histidine kinase [Spiractinospora alimapuensis]
MITATPTPSTTATLESAQDDASRRRLRRARRYVLGYGALNVVFYPLLAVTSLLVYPEFDNAFWFAAAFGIPLSLLQAVLVYWIYRLRFGMPSRLRRSVVVWGSIVPLVLLCSFYGFTPSSGVYIGVWWGVVTLVATRGQVVIISTGLCVAWSVAAVLVLPLAPLWEVVFVYLYTFGMAGLSAATNHAFATMWDVAQDAHNSRWVQARLAVTEERQRIARDLHDLLGHSLSGIAVKSELAARLAHRDPDRAAAEMLTVQALAREALREMRATVSNYRELDLAVEISNVRQVLDAGGTTCTIAGSDVDMTLANRGVAAWVIREAVTNVLRHSTASQCDITLSRRGEVAVVEIFNDGAGDTGSAPESRHTFGNGLRGLTERVTAVNGTLTANPTADGGFLVRALLPDAPPKATPSPTDEAHHPSEATVTPDRTDHARSDA